MSLEDLGYPCVNLIPTFWLGNKLAQRWTIDFVRMLTDQSQAMHLRVCILFKFGEWGFVVLNFFESLLFSYHHLLALGWACPRIGFWFSLWLHYSDEDFRVGLILDALGFIFNFGSIAMIGCSVSAKQRVQLINISRAAFRKSLWSLLWN
jgi:hypothetical protein